MGAASRRAPADPPGPVHRASEHHRGPPRSGRPALGRRAGGAGRQRTIPRPPDLTAAPARICKFMFPAALANRSANETGACLPAHELPDRCISMRHTRLAETSSFAADRVGFKHAGVRQLQSSRRADALFGDKDLGVAGRSAGGPELAWVRESRHGRSRSMTCSGLASLSASVLSRCRETITPSITALTSAARSAASSAAIGLLICA